LIFLPYLLLKGIKSKRWWSTIVAGLVGLATLVPMLDATFLSGIQSSLDLYFRKFEFNASLYFIAREIGYRIYGYNTIGIVGPFLSILSTLSILVISAIGIRKRWHIPTTFLFILSSYLLFATTVHPWYIIPLIAFGVIAGYWFPIVWSFMIFFTYAGYTSTGFELPYYIPVIEYILVFIVFLYEVNLRVKIIK